MTLRISLDQGFDGYITSDCDAVANVVAPHHYVNTSEGAVAVTLKAGMDIDCSYFVGQHGAKALQVAAPPPCPTARSLLFTPVHAQLGLIDEALIDARLSNLFRVRMRLQHFDPPGPLQRVPTSAICPPEVRVT